MTTAGGLITPINLNDTTAQTCGPHAEPPPTPTARPDTRCGWELRGVNVLTSASGGGVVEVAVGAVKSGGRYARAELVIKAGGRQAKFSVEMSYTVKIQFNSSNREAAEEAAQLLRQAGVDVELKNYWDKSVNREKWYVKASIDKLAAARKELREAIAQAIREAEKKGLVDSEKAKTWLQKLQ
jgi:hypothetical protein